MKTIPVITIDGPSGSGKGTIAQLLAKKLGWHFLDSGALYRAVALAVLHADINPEDTQAVQAVLSDIEIAMRLHDNDQSADILLNNDVVTQDIRSEECSRTASITSAIPAVREMLLDRQRAFRQTPGLVTDGRDMGTIIFPDAVIKFYLTASLDERASRRFHQLKKAGKHVSLASIRGELCARDERDENRDIAPAKPADNVILIDTTTMNVDSVLQEVLQHAASY